MSTYTPPLHKPNPAGFLFLFLFLALEKIALSSDGGSAGMYLRVTLNEKYIALKDCSPIHATTWVNFEDIMPCEISQMQKDKYCVIPFI